MQEVFSVEERTEIAAHLSGENRLHGGFRLLFKVKTVTTLTFLSSHKL